MDCFAIHLFFPSSNRREAKKGCREQVPCWGMGRRPITPPRWIASQSIPLPPSSNRHEAKKGCREQVPCWGMGRQPHHSPSMDCISIHLLSPLSKPPRSEERVQGTMFPAGVWGDAPSLPLDGLHRNPSALPFLQTAAKRRWESEGQASLRRGLGRQPHHSPLVPRSSPPSLDAYLSPFHHRRTRSARKRIKLPVRHVFDSVVRLYRTRRRRSRRRYAVAMRRRHAPA